MRILLFALLIWNQPEALARENIGHLYNLACVEALRPAPQDPELIRTYIRFQNFTYWKYDKGFDLIPVTDRPNSIQHNFYINELQNPLENWPSQIWESRGEAYRFFDIGFRNMEDDAKALNQLVYNHIMNFPHDRMHVEYGPNRLTQIEKMHTARFTVHGRVLDAYEEAKPYLKAKDYWALYYASRQTTNNDIIALFKNDPKFKWIDQTVDSIERNLMATIQITYYGIEDHFEPTLRGVLRQSGNSISLKDDLFPFELRLGKEERAHVRKKLFAKYDPQTACEVTRYANFVNRMPREITDRLILEVLNRVQERGIKTIFVSADAITLRLFRRYGVRPFVDLPTGSGVKETLGVLEVDSDLFRQVYQRLSENSKQVKVTKVARPKFN